MLPLYDVIPSREKPVVTYGLIGLNVLVFLVEVVLPDHVLEAVLFKFGLVPLRFWSGWMQGSSEQIVEDSVMPLLTSMVLHGGWFHLIGNMWTLWIFGDNVEDRMGHIRFLLFYVLCGVVAGVTHAWIYADSLVPTIGASGAISGVMGAYMMLFPYSRVVTLVPIFFFFTLIEVPALIYLGVWFLGQFLAGATSLAMGGSNIAFWAHIGGFVAGVLLHRFFVHRPPYIPTGSAEPWEEDSEDVVWYY